MSRWFLVLSLWLGCGGSRCADGPPSSAAPASGPASASTTTKEPETLAEATPENPLTPSPPERPARNGPSGPRPPIDLAALTVPEGFSLSRYSDEVPYARSLARGPEGVVFVSTRQSDRVYALVDEDGDHRDVEVHVVADGLPTPNGIAYRGGDLYIAQIGRIVVLRGIDRRIEDPPEPEVVTDALPEETHHGWRYLRFGPDGMLYVAVGAPCNVCLRDEPIFASIARMKADGTGLEVFARGIRNSVGFDWHPETKDLWFTDNGRDELGDDLPPCELNRAAKAGLHFGFPHCHAGVIRDPELGTDCTRYEPPVQQLGAHVAPLGMRFYTGTAFPKAYRGAVILAEHGSWNRSEKSGYRVATVRLEGGEAVAYEPLVSGFVDGDRVRGRPVDVEVLDDGSLLISDDWQGAVYRLTHETPSP